MTAPGIDPWEQQPGESPKAFAAFVLYRSMAPSVRSLNKLPGDQYRIKSGSISSTVRDWCQKHEWVKRAAAWDAHVDAEARRAELSEVKKMRERHVKLGLTMQTLAGRIIQAKFGEKMDDQAQMKGVFLTDLVKLMREGVNVERGARGEPEVIKEQRIEFEPERPKLGDYSSDQLRSMRDILANPANRHPAPDPDGPEPGTGDEGTG